MKKNNYIQPVDICEKPTTCEIIRSILWGIGQILGAISIFAIMYAITIFVSTI